MQVLARQRAFPCLSRNRTKSHPSIVTCSGSSPSSEPSIAGYQKFINTAVTSAGCKKPHKFFFCRLRPNEATSLVTCYRPRRRLVNKPDFPERLSFANRHALNGIALTNRIDDILTGSHFAEHSMAPVQVRLGRVRDKKLAAIGVRSRVGHRQ